ncbi:hypothetical protein TPENAI_61151 [Tenacibaculum litopenaei]|uniref:hypothetical protein n=1 Tax=Tenacibaculum litopenaei TaxID=396016 RepID=UPI0038944049
MRNHTLITILVLSFLSCKPKNSINSSKEEGTVKNSGEVEVLYENNDTILKFVSNKKGYGIFHWGIVDKFMNHSKDSLYLDVIDRDITKIGNSFVYTKACGTACKFSLVLPVAKEKQGVVLMYPLIKDQKSGFLIAKGDEDNVLVSIMDLKTFKVRKIEKAFDLKKVPPSLAIDTLWINHLKLSVKWIDKEGKLDFGEFELTQK